jgi:predicted nucleotidyltransferase
VVQLRHSIESKLVPDLCYNSAMNKNINLAMPLPMDAIADFCKKWGIVKLSVFGSILRDDFRADSDVDFLAEFAPGAKRGFISEFEMEEELENIVGRKVDLLDSKLLSKSQNPYKKSLIFGSAEELIHAPV